MFLPVFQDLVKPQWRNVLEELKSGGAQPVSELSRALAASYMAVKQHCEELRKAGYVERTREPRTAVGRPEIFYSLSAKADRLFPETGAEFVLEILDGLKTLFGESAPDKALFQHFQRQTEKWLPALAKETSLAGKTAKLARLRQAAGCASECREDPRQGLALVELHNPLQRIFEIYPRAVAMEQRAIEDLLGVRVTRHEIPSGRSVPPRVTFQVLPAVAR